MTYRVNFVQKLATVPPDTPNRSGNVRNRVVKSVKLKDEHGAMSNRCKMNKILNVLLGPTSASGGGISLDHQGGVMSGVVKFCASLCGCGT